MFFKGHVLNGQLFKTDSSFRRTLFRRTLLKDGHFSLPFDRIKLEEFYATLVGLSFLYITILYFFFADLKKLYFMAGVDNKPTIFLFNDTQVLDESFLEDINNILSSGEVPNLYKPDEFEEVRLNYRRSFRYNDVMTNVNEASEPRFAVVTL